MSTKEKPQATYTDAERQALEDSPRRYELDSRDIDAAKLRITLWWIKRTNLVVATLEELESEPVRAHEWLVAPDNVLGTRDHPYPEAYRNGWEPQPRSENDGA